MGASGKVQRLDADWTDQIFDLNWSALIGACRW